MKIAGIISGQSLTADDEVFHLTTSQICRIRSALAAAAPGVIAGWRFRLNRHRRNILDHDLPAEFLAMPGFGSGRLRGDTRHPDHASGFLYSDMSISPSSRRPCSLRFLLAASAYSSQAPFLNGWFELMSPCKNHRCQSHHHAHPDHPPLSPIHLSNEHGIMVGTGSDAPVPVAISCCI